MLLPLDYFYAMVKTAAEKASVPVSIHLDHGNSLTGFDAVIHVAFPQAEIQNCIVHQLRNSSK